MRFIRVNVWFKGRRKILKLYIIKGEGSPIVGRDWIKSLSIPINEGIVWSLTEEDNYKEFSSVFSNILGCYKSKTFKLCLKHDIKPIFFKPRILPFMLKDKVSKKIDRLVDKKLLIPVETSEWATPIVPVVKGDGRIQLCGDYKTTLNKFLEVDIQYPELTI